MEDQDVSVSSLLKTRPPKALHATAMRYRKSVVAIMVTDDDGMSYGSGFILRGGPGGSLVVTCEHIVREATSIRVRRVVGVGEGGGVEDYAATMICKHREPDIALLRVPDLIQPSLALNLAVPQVGLNYPAISVGNACPADGPGGNWDGSTLVRLPSTLPGCICECDGFVEFCKVDGEPGKRRILCEVQDDDKVKLVMYETLFLNCETVGGMSGGPIVGAQGVIGMGCKMSDDGLLMLAVSSSTIIQVLKLTAGLHVDVIRD